MTAAPAADEPLQRTPLYELHVALGARWCRSPATRCRCSIRGHPRGAPAHAGPGRALRCLAYGAGVSDRGRSADGRRARSAGARRSSGPGARAAALHPAAQRRRRHPRRSDGHSAPQRMTTAAVPGRQRRAQGGRLRAHLRAPRRRGQLAAAPDRALLALQGRRQPAARRPSCRAPRLGFMTRRAGVRRPSIAMSPAPATPARTGSRCRCRRSTRRRWPQLLLAEPEVQADRPWRARFAAARGRALPLRPRHRRDDHPGRGRARLDDPEAAAQRGRVPRRERIQRSWPRGPAPARRHPARRARAGARGRRGPVAAGERIGVITSGGFGPSVNGPVAMGYVQADHAKVGTPANLMVRGKALSAAVAPLPFVPHRYVRERGVSDPPLVSGLFLTSRRSR